MKHVAHINHPLMHHKLGYLRDKNTNSAEFRQLMAEMTYVLVYEAMRDWQKMKTVNITTPIADTQAERIVNPPVIVSVMRAGNGMVDAALTMLPFSSTGYIGIYRDKQKHNIVEYYFKMPDDIKNKDILLCDPLIATADTIVAALDRLKEAGVGRIKVLSILSSVAGIDKLKHFHPDVEIFTLNIEQQINEVGYLVPGLGDAGDRLFQTK